MNQQLIGRLSMAGNYRWTICALLFFATTINYLDRQVLSLLAPQLSTEFGWSNTDYANITAVFQFVYALSMLFAGRLIDKSGTKWGYLIAIVIWSIGAMMHAYAVPLGELGNNMLALAGIAAVPVSVVGFMVSRAILALGEAGNFPAAIKATAEYFPKKERSLATGIFNSGANVGAILAPLSVPWIAAHWGWQTAFIFIGALGFIWMLFWHRYYERPQQQVRLSTEEFTFINSDSNESLAVVDAVISQKVSWFKLLKYQQTWAFTFGKFMTDGVWWFFLFWLPKYLGEQYGVKGTELMLPLCVLYSMTMIGSIGGGALPIYFINRGCNIYDGRMKAMLLIALFPLVVLLAQPLGNISFWIPVILIGIGASAHQAWSANMFTTVSDMFPKKSVASVVGIGGFAGGMGGVLMSKTGGWLFDYYGAMGQLATGYSIMFVICALAYLVAWVVMKLLVPKYKPIMDL
jgi:ACS family hexuronate transporter-like MFS transporter